jgi:hypothetical protein
LDARGRHPPADTFRIRQLHHPRGGEIKTNHVCNQGAHQFAQNIAQSGIEGEMNEPDTPGTTDFPNSRERQFMQHLRAGGWVKASVAPGGVRLIGNLLAKGWIEKPGITATEISYRLTDKGLGAKKEFMPM